MSSHYSICITVAGAGLFDLCNIYLPENWLEDMNEKLITITIGLFIKNTVNMRLNTEIFL